MGGAPSKSTRISELEEERDPLLGEWLRGKYRLDRVLGEGGMATVYAATHRNKNRVAIKILKPGIMKADMVRRFLREGRVANTVDHPGAVAVLDDDVTDAGAPFLVMELLEGDPVEALINRNRRLTSADVLGIAYQVLDVLAAAHAKNVVHRDLKPANLFLTRSGTVKVLDFGIARLRDENGGAASETSTGILMGTPAFMAPEQARGRVSRVGPRTDIWAVGATMFNLLTGTTVYEGESSQEIVFRAGTTPARGVAEVVTDVPTKVAAVIDRALMFDDEERWPSAAAMRDTIRAAYEELFGKALDPSDLQRLLAKPDAVIESDPSIASFAPAAVSARTLPMSAETERMAPAQTVAATTSDLGAPTTETRRSWRGAVLVVGVIGIVLALVASLRLGVGLGAARVVTSDTTPVPVPSASVIGASVAASVEPPPSPPPPAAPSTTSTSVAAPPALSARPEVRPAPPRPIATSVAPATPRPARPSKPAPATSTKATDFDHQ